jgi:hypothetical protein
MRSSSVGTAQRYLKFVPSGLKVTMYSPLLTAAIWPF